MNGLIVLIIFIILLAIVIFTHIQVVPKGKMYVIERKKQFYKTANSGIIFLVPFIDKIKTKFNSQTNYLPVEPIEIETNDSIKKDFKFNDIGFIIEDVKKLVYDHSDYNKDLLSIIYKVTLNITKNYTAEELKIYQTDIEKTLKDTLNIKVKSFGIKITSTKFKIN